MQEKLEFQFLLQNITYKKQISFLVLALSVTGNVFLYSKKKHYLVKIFLEAGCIRKESIYNIEVEILVKQESSNSKIMQYSNYLN